MTAVKSANHVFPWSLVYDHDFIDGAGNTLCPEVEVALAAGATVDDLVALPCFVAECPHRADSNVVCPSGFWGFRHIIEQPLISPRAAQGATSTSPADVALEIPLGGAPNLNVLIGVREALADWEAHTDSATTTLSRWADRSSSVVELVDALKRQATCTSRTFTATAAAQAARPGSASAHAREEERLFPQYLKSVKWPTEHPFVFINGCRTVGVSPDDLLGFNKMLALSGSVGSARHRDHGSRGSRSTGRAHVSARLPSPRAVGATVRRIRLELLTQYNPLGLAYTPYCMAALRVTS